MSLHPVEEATVRAFIVSERRPRYLQQMADPKRRARFLDRLNHCRDLDPRFATPAQNVTAAQLRSIGAPARCRLISDAGALDGREMSLHEALNETSFQGFGTIICCIPGRLAYYRGEDGEAEYVLVRDTP